jgi:hypothetical protein
MSAWLLLTAQQIAFKICQIAEMRVDAQTWDFIAAHFQIPTVDLREFLFTKDKEFRQQVRIARRDQREFDGDAAYKTLRQQMSGDDEKICHSAACTIAKLNVAEKRIKAMCQKKIAKPTTCPEGYLEIAKLSPLVRQAISEDKLSVEEQSNLAQKRYRFSYRCRYKWGLVDPQKEEPCPKCGILPSGVLPDGNYTWFFDDEARARALKNLADLQDAEKNGFTPPQYTETVVRAAQVFGGLDQATGKSRLFGEQGA